MLFLFFNLHLWFSQFVCMFLVSARIFFLDRKQDETYKNYKTVILD